MRPLTVLIGIVMGSTVSLAVGLVLTWTVFLFLPEFSERLEPERGPLLRAIALFGLMALAASFSFYGELRSRSWRFAAYAALLALIAVAVGVYWPE